MPKHYQNPDPNADAPIDLDEMPEVEVVEEVARPPATAINLPRAYSGRRTNEQWIPAGVYLVDDPRLMGLAEYLIESGHATRD